MQSQICGAIGLCSSRQASELKDTVSRRLLARTKLLPGRIRAVKPVDTLKQGEGDERQTPVWAELLKANAHAGGVPVSNVGGHSTLHEYGFWLFTSRQACTT